MYEAALSNRDMHLKCVNCALNEIAKLVYETFSQTIRMIAFADINYSNISKYRFSNLYSYIEAYHFKSTYH